VVPQAPLAIDMTSASARPSRSVRVDSLPAAACVCTATPSITAVISRARARTSVSPKGLAIERAGRFALVVQDESLPCRYVSVDDPVVESRRCELDRDLVPPRALALGRPRWALAALGERSS